MKIRRIENVLPLPLREGVGGRGARRRELSGARSSPAPSLKGRGRLLVLKDRPHALHAACQPAALRRGGPRVQLGPPGGVRGARPQPARHLQREGGAAPRPRPVRHRPAERGRHGAGLHRAAPLPRGGPCDGRPAVRGAGHRRRARRPERSGLRRRAGSPHARRADPRPVRPRRKPNTPPRACCAASPPPTASWPISAAARWRWCASPPASGANRRPCGWG